jgi:hypothetical protein
MTRERIALIGFGEVGRTLAADLGVSRGELNPLLDELLRAIPFTQRNIA